MCADGIGEERVGRGREKVVVVEGAGGVCIWGRRRRGREGGEAGEESAVCGREGEKNWQESVFLPAAVFAMLL